MAEAAKPATSSAMIAFYMALNFFSSILIVWTNKLAFVSGFKWTITLTAVHFLFTFIGLEISARYGLFEKKPLPIQSVIPISAAFCGFVVFNNLSLQYNAVGLYQLLKVMTTPTIIVLEYILYKQMLPFDQILSLVPICIGVVLASVTHVQVNFWGMVFGVLGILSTSLYQIWVKKEQENLRCSSPQLLYYQAPVSMGMLCMVIPFMEDLLSSQGLLHFKPQDPLCMPWVVASSVLAFLVNLSIFLVIGKTSPISYNVLGHGKLVCIILSGYFMFNEPVNPKNIAGVVLTLIGIFWYTHLKLNQAAVAKDKKTDAPKRPASLQPSPSCESGSGSMPQRSPSASEGDVELAKKKPSNPNLGVSNAAIRSPHHAK